MKLGLDNCQEILGLEEKNLTLVYQILADDKIHLSRDWSKHLLDIIRSEVLQVPSYCNYLRRIIPRIAWLACPNYALSYSLVTKK